MMIYHDIMHFEIMFSRTVTTDQTIEAILFTPVSEELHRGIGTQVLSVLASVCQSLRFL